MKVIIKSSFALLLLALVGSCATGNVVVTDSPPLPNTPQPSTQTTTQTPSPQEEKMETRSSGASVFQSNTAQKSISSTKLNTISSTIQE